MVPSFAARTLHEMTTPIELILLNRSSEIARLQDQLEALARQLGLSPKALHEVQLALEEHLTNILNYAFEDHREHQISVRIQTAATELRVEVEDDGRPFDPLKHPVPDMSQPLSARPIGGLGIHMMRKSMDRIEYHRADGKNILVMIKEIKVPAP
jgi:anti-sigma regulatory factor (Ser/Thr protein kinase)